MSKKFFEKVYEIVGKIPEGKVATYGQVASLLGEPRNARVVGWAMSKAPSERNLPCHRVINKTGKLSPEYIFGSKYLQRDLLEAEGVFFNKDGTVDLKRSMWNGYTEL